MPSIRASQPPVIFPRRTPTRRPPANLPIALASHREAARPSFTLHHKYNGVFPFLDNLVPTAASGHLVAIIMPEAVLTRKDVAKHRSFDDLWLIIDNAVWDFTDFVREHPGGIDRKSVV